MASAILSSTAAHIGNIMLYDPSPSKGSCGYQHYPFHMVVPLSKDLVRQRSNSNTRTKCLMEIKILNSQNGRKVRAIVSYYVDGKILLLVLTRSSRSWDTCKFCKGGNIAATDAVLYALAPDANDTVTEIQWNGASSVALGKRDETAWETCFNCLPESGSLQPLVDLETAARPRIPHSGPPRGRFSKLTTGEWSTDACAPTRPLGEEATQTQLQTVKTGSEYFSAGSKRAPVTLSDSKTREGTNIPFQDPRGNRRKPIPPSSTIEKEQLAPRDGGGDEDEHYCEPMNFHQYPCDDPRDPQSKEQQDAEDNYGGFRQYADGPPPSSKMEKRRRASRADGEDMEYCDPWTVECRSALGSQSKKQESSGPIKREPLVPRDFVA